ASQPAGGITSGPGSIVPHATRHSAAMSSIRTTRDMRIARIPENAASRKARVLVRCSPVPEPQTPVDSNSPTPRAADAPLQPQPLVALIGRDAQLAQLDAIFARAVDYQAPQLI